MNLEKISASAYKLHTHCPQAYFINQNLKWILPAGKSADRGTCVHRVLEILAEQKLARQKSEKYFATEETGEIGACETIPIVELARDVYDYFIVNKAPHHDWEESDFNECMKYINTALSHGNGMFNPLNREIISSEKYVRITPEEDWAYLPNGGKLAMTGFIDLVMAAGDDAIEILDWKGLPVDTPILTENGWVDMGDVKVGDFVFDQNGQKTKIIGKSKPKYKDCFKIAFDDKSEIICDYEHLWKLSNGETKSITELQIGDTIPYCKAINFDYKHLPIDPYVLGIWLGIGNNNGSILEPEEFILEKMQNRGYSTSKNNGSITRPKYTVYGLTQQLKQLGLLDNKFIPPIYLQSSIVQRQDLLNGLLDSIGKYFKYHDLIEKNDDFNSDLKQLLLSLGEINNKKRTITNIEKLTTQLKTQCIKVNSPYSTYICGRDYIVTHNTGQQKDFHSGKELNEDTLRDDIQLKMYHYAATKIYGADKTFLVTIFFLKTGCPITISFTPNDLEDTKNKIRDKMSLILKDALPRRNITWKCKKFCEYGKNTFYDISDKIQPYIQMHDGVAKMGETMTICDQVNFETIRNGMQWVINNMCCGCDPNIPNV